MSAISQKTLSKVIAHPSLYLTDLTKVIILNCIAKGRTKVHMKMIFDRNIGPPYNRPFVSVCVYEWIESTSLHVRKGYTTLIKTCFLCAIKRNRDAKSTTEKWFHSPKNKVNVAKLILTILSCKPSQLEWHE